MLPQGLTHLGLASAQLGSLLGHAANMAALQSLFLGQLPPATADEASDLLAGSGLLGSLLPPELPPDAADGAGDEMTAGEASAWQVAAGDASSRSRGGGSGRLPGLPHPAVHPLSDAAAVPRLFSAQQQRLSLPQMRLYNSHTLAGEEADEGGFEGNFS